MFTYSNATILEGFLLFSIHNFIFPQATLEHFTITLQITFPATEAPADYSGIQMLPSSTIKDHQAPQKFRIQDHSI